MNTVQRITKNIAVLLISRITNYILNFLFFMYTARYLGAEGFGILSFALAFTGIFGVFTDLGLRQLTIREVARNKSLAGKYLANISVIKVILAAITFGLMTVVINLLEYPKKTIEVVYLIALSVIFSAFTQIFNSIFQAFEKMEYVSLGEILKSVLIFSGVIFVIKQEGDVISFASLFLIASIIVLIYSLLILRWKFANPVFTSTNKLLKVDWSFWKSMIREALPFGLTSIFVTIYYRIDSVMLSLMKGNEVVGWYNAAYRLIMVLMFIPVIFQNAVFPVTSRLFKTSEESLKFVSERFFKYMIIIGIPIGIGTTLLADRIILLVFGVEYTPSITALQILVWGVIFAFIAVPFENLFYSANKQFIVTIEVGIAAILNVIMNLLLIPKYSLLGASIATTVIWIFEFFFVFIWISKTKYNISKKTVLNITLKALVSGLIMGIFILYFKSNLLIAITFSVLIFFGTLYIIRGFDRNDIIIIKELILKPKTHLSKMG